MVHDKTVANRVLTGQAVSQPTSAIIARFINFGYNDLQVIMVDNYLAQILCNQMGYNKPIGYDKM